MHDIFDSTSDPLVESAMKKIQEKKLSNYKIRKKKNWKTFVHQSSE